MVHNNLSRFLADIERIEQDYGPKETLQIIKSSCKHVLKDPEMFLWQRRKDTDQLPPAGNICGIGVYFTGYMAELYDENKDAQVPQLVEGSVLETEE